MPRVIYKFKLKLRHGSGGLDPYSYNSNLRLRIKRRFIQTLGTFDFRPWRSGTFIQTQKLSRCVGIAASSLLILIAVFTIHPVILSDRSAEATIGTANPSNSVINIATGESADLNITAASSDGTFAQAKDEDMATFTVTTDNFTGYTLKLSGTESDLINSETSKTISSITSAVSASNFASGDSSDYNNRWGYQTNLLNTSTSAYAALNDGNFLPAPAIVEPEDKIVDLNTTTDANGSIKHPDTVDTYGIRLGARIDYTIPTGDYTNTFVVTVVANPIAYTITYADSTGDSSVTNLPSKQSGSESTTSITIDPEYASSSITAPSRTGYTFAGWCLGTVTHTASQNSTCSGGTSSIYHTGDTFGIDQTLDNTNITLYALWNVDTYNVQVNFAGNGVQNVTFAATGETTQTISTSGNKATLKYGMKYTVTMNFTSTSYVFDSWSLNNSSYGTLSSTSTNPTYFTPNALSGGAVITAKGKNAKIYMQNLASSECTTTATTVYDSRDEQAYVIQRLADNNCWMLDNLRLGSMSESTPLTSSNTNIATNYSLPVSDTKTGSSFTYTYTSPNIYAGLKDTVGTNFGGGIGSGKIGTYYNYCAVSGGTICTNSNSSNASYDICPAGWRMPTGGESGEYKQLYAAYSNNASLFTKALSATSSGCMGRYCDGYLDTVGSLYTSTAGENTNDVCIISFSGSAVGFPCSGSPRGQARPVRCILK